MSKFQILKGSTSVLVRVFIQDASKTNGSGLTGLTNASSGLTCYVARDDDGNAAATVLALSGGTRGTWSSGGFKEKDATNQPGVYELGLSNASLATASRSCTYYLQGAANMAPCIFEIELTNTDNQSSTFGLGTLTANTTQLAGQTVTAAAGVTFPTSVASPTNITAGTITTVSGNVTGSVGSVTGLTASNLDATISSRMATYTQPTGFLAATFPGTVASTTNITAGTITTTTNLTNAPPDSASITAIKAKTDSLAFTVAGQVDANTESINATTVLGNGTSGNLWRG